MISKELLSEVLDKDVISMSSYEENTLGYLVNEDDYYQINIYELAHKCKEWILKHKTLNVSVISISCQTEPPNICHSFVSYYCFEIKDFAKACFSGETEIETVIHACQWILDDEYKS
ncbi:hypothetical protein [Arcobacter arenosus]|uniref:Uncharacterized protein n=1 Tax=Arcobacter arenosus TaxID=2576037 RepID=A0A5R8Y4K7_9BACT|nr:hypothetical protein [Arcobacter arenosus]TLP41064.1 hypothetical protein FDK22_03320 [Arcobacter arenosus]